MGLTPKETPVNGTERVEIIMQARCDFQLRAESRGMKFDGAHWTGLPKRAPLLLGKPQINVGYYSTLDGTPPTRERMPQFI
jgi:hypothetical protein